MERGLTSALAELTDALLAIADPSSRRALVSPFRSRIADAITEHPRARAHVLAIVRPCLKYEGRLDRLLEVVRCWNRRRCRCGIWKRRSQMSCTGARPRCTDCRSPMPIPLNKCGNAWSFAEEILRFGSTSSPIKWPRLRQQLHGRSPTAVADHR